jgi:hypothetical protein
MNSHARSAIENGFTAQLTKSVTPMPLTCWRSSDMAEKSTFSNIGMIISQIRTATGRLTRATSMPPTTRKSPGMKWPRVIPATMHSATQRVRNRSNIPMAGAGRSPTQVALIGVLAYPFCRAGRPAALVFQIADPINLGLKLQLVQ